MTRVSGRVNELGLSTRCIQTGFVYALTVWQFLFGRTKPTEEKTKRNLSENGDVIPCLAVNTRVKMVRSEFEYCVSEADLYRKGMHCCVSSFLTVTRSS